MVMGDTTYVPTHLPGKKRELVRWMQWAETQRNEPMLCSDDSRSYVHIALCDDYTTLKQSMACMHGLGCVLLVPDFTILPCFVLENQDGKKASIEKVGR